MNAQMPDRYGHTVFFGGQKKVARGFCRQRTPPSRPLPGQAANRVRRRQDCDPERLVAGSCLNLSEPQSITHISSLAFLAIMLNLM